MASGRAPGLYSMYIETASNNRFLIKQADAAFWNVSNLGSPDGVISSTATPEKWNVLPKSAIGGKPGSKIVVTYTASTTDTLDASDSVMILPVTVNGQPETIGFPGGGGGGLGNGNFTAVTNVGDTLYTANTEQLVFSVRANEGVFFNVGANGLAGRVFASLENDTA